MAETITTVRDSMGRCIFHGNLVERFYEIFLDSDPKIKPMFANTDMEKQKQLLDHGLSLAILYVSGHAMGKRGLQRLRESHSRNNLNVSPELYPFWKQSLIQAVTELDPEYTDDIGRAWDEVLQQAIDYIAEGY